MIRAVQFSFRKFRAWRRRLRNRRIRKSVITLGFEKPRRRGRALLAYLVEPFLDDRDTALCATHTKFTESQVIAELLMELGFEVDVIDFENRTYIPRKKYDLFISARKHFERYAKLLGPDCIKIAHLDTSHWRFNNEAALRRCTEVEARRGEPVRSYRPVEKNRAVESADYAVMLGNQTTIATYRFAGKKIHPLPVPAIRIYPEPEKDFEMVRRRFMWMGSAGFVQKGLDLVLEAFAEMPDYELTVCGPVEKEREFRRVFDRELYRLPNIRTVGWVDVSDDSFSDLANDNVGLVYPSCAEGQAGAVVTCMHAGLIPIVSPESGMDITEECGRELRELSVREIRRVVKEVASLPGKTLSSMAVGSWSYARKNHNRQNYATRYRAVLEQILEKDMRTNGTTADVQRSSAAAASFGYRS